MATFFYNFPSEAAYNELMTVTEVTTAEDGTEVVETSTKVLDGVDVVGLMFKNYGSEAEPDMRPINGWHVNTTSPVDDWEEYQVFPKTAARVFWGS